MIGQIQGTLLQNNPPLLLIDVGGIGYEANASTYTICQLPKIGNTVKLSRGYDTT